MSQNLHSSALPPGSPIPKTVNGRSRVDDRLARLAAEESEKRACYRLVDARDQGRCRVCGRRCDPRAVAIKDTAEHHHLVKQSQTNAHETHLVILICRRCHDLIHVKALLTVTGDADARDANGVLCGLVVKRFEPETGAWMPVGVS